MDETHWSARACCVASVILGVASVTTATQQHLAIGMLKSPLDVRLWLSRGRPTLYRHGYKMIKMHKNLADAVSSLNSDLVKDPLKR